MPKKQKLELTWIGKVNRPKLEPRILLEEVDKSYHAAHRVSDPNQSSTFLITEGPRNDKLHSPVNAQDKVNHQIEELIVNCDAKLTQRTILQSLFNIEWSLCACAANHAHKAFYAQ